MGVVDREAAHAREPAEFAGLLVAIDLPELGQTHRQLAVRPPLVRIDLDVMRAVHGLEQVALFVALVVGVERHRGELAVFVIGIVPAGFPEFEPSDVRRDHGQIAAFELFLFEERDEGLPHDGPFGQPQRQARSYLVAVGTAIGRLPKSVRQCPELRMQTNSFVIVANFHRILFLIFPQNPGHLLRGIAMPFN